MSLSHWALLSSVKNQNGTAPFEHSEQLANQLKTKQIRIATNNLTNWFFNDLASPKDPYRESIREISMQSPVIIQGSVQKFLDEVAVGRYVWPTDHEAVEDKNYHECGDAQSDPPDGTTGDTTHVICKYTVPCF
ncbi:Protein W02A2.5 [Aphelenchoides avenae]|nr:Protein W02A2.5 [Aphelenchus avenae]